MKKENFLKKVSFILLVLFIGIRNFCFADIVVRPGNGEKFGEFKQDPYYEKQQFKEEIVQHLLNISIQVLIGIYVLSIVCLIISKVSKKEKILCISNKVFENIFYYGSAFIGLVISTLLIKEYFIFCFIGYIVLALSFILRCVNKDKKKSYFGLVIFFIVIAIVLVVANLSKAELCLFLLKNYY